MYFVLLSELYSFTLQPMIQLEKPVPTGTMPVVWPTILDLGRDECKRILRKLGKVNFSFLIKGFLTLSANEIVHLLSSFAGFLQCN